MSTLGNQPEIKADTRDLMRATASQAAARNDEAAPRRTDRPPQGDDVKPPDDALRAGLAAAIGERFGAEPDDEALDILVEAALLRPEPGAGTPISTSRLLLGVLRFGESHAAEAGKSGGARAGAATLSAAVGADAVAAGRLATLRKKFGIRRADEALVALKANWFSKNASTILGAAARGGRLRARDLIASTLRFADSAWKDLWPGDDIRERILRALDPPGDPPGRTGLIRPEREAEAEYLGLDVEDRALALARLIRGAGGEFSLGLFGRWGIGKTALAGRITHHLEDPDSYRNALEDRFSLTPGPQERSQYHVVRYSAWQFQRPPECWIFLLEAFASCIRSLPMRERAAIAVRRMVLSIGLPALVLLLSMTALALGRSAFLALMLVYVLPIIGISALLYLVFAFRGAQAQLGPALGRLFRFSEHGDKLGLQAVIGDDLRVLLRAWMPFPGEPVSRLAWSVAAALLSMVAILWMAGLARGPLGGILAEQFSWTPCPSLAWFIEPAACEASLKEATGPVPWVALVGWCVLALGAMLPLWPAAALDRQVLLVVDDLDRCASEDMLRQIEAVKLVLEDKEVQARVKLLVLVDEDALHAATAAKFRELIAARSGSDPDAATEALVVREHMEKLFMCHYRVPELRRDDAMEVVRGIVRQANSRTGPDASANSAGRQSAEVGPSSPEKETPKPAPTPDVKQDPVDRGANPVDKGRYRVQRGLGDGGIVFDQQEEAAMIAVLPAVGSPQPTPRALRAFAARFMLARSLLHLTGSSHDPAALAAALAAATLRAPAQMPAPGDKGSIAWAVRQVA